MGSLDFALAIVGGIVGFADRLAITARVFCSQQKDEE